MDENQVVILGNGFDVNHGIPSSYAHFKTWLSNNDKELFDFLERYIDENNLKGIQPQIDVVARMLNGLRATLKKKA